MYRWVKAFCSIALAALFLQSQVAFAASAGFVGVPTMWRLESYGEKNVVLWFTPSKCANGKITLPSTATTVEHNRFYATIMAAKISNAPIFVFYDDAIDGCPIISYGLREGN